MFGEVWTGGTSRRVPQALIVEQGRTSQMERVTFMVHRGEQRGMDALPVAAT
jgi:hypothetical protein